MSDQQSQPALVAELEALRARVTELEEAADRRMRDERVLRESEQLYRSLVETSPDSIVVADLDGQILMANQQTVPLYGFETLSDVLKLNVIDLVAPESVEQARRDIRRILKTGGLRDREHLLRRRDGTTFHGEVSGSLISDDNGRPKYVLYIGRDITDRLRLQRELAEAQKIESIGRLAGGIAHDFNNLLAVVLGNASLLLRNQSLPKKTLDCLQDIVQAAERASSLTTQLLAYARGGLRRAAPADVNRIVSAAWTLVSRTAPRQMGVKMELTQGLPAISVDQAQIQQVVMNLCLNAIQASEVPGQVVLETGGASVDAESAEKLELPPGQYVCIRVRDRGCGMDRSTVERAFEPFFTTKPDARGMGLPAAQGIVQSHGGRLIISSVPGEGTEAAVWLPVHSVTENNAAAGPAITNVPHGNETILVVDVDPTVSRTAGQILASLGYCVVTHSDEDQALAFMASNCEDVDLIMLNPSTPKRTPAQMLEVVLDHCAAKPILLTSGSAPNGDIEALAARSQVGFLPKPFSLMSLAQAVRKLLDQAGPRQVAESD